MSGALGLQVPAGRGSAGRSRARHACSRGARPGRVTGRVALVAACVLAAIAFLSATARAESTWDMEGLGRWVDGYDLAARGAGWTAVGVRDSLGTSVVNPALIAWAGLPTAHFGLLSENRWIQDTGPGVADRRAQVRVVAPRVILPGPGPLRWGIGYGDLTDASYEFSQLHNSGREDQYRRTVTGSSGVGQISGDLAIKLWRNRLALGGQLGFLVGTLKDDIVDDYVDPRYIDTHDEVRTRVRNGHCWSIGTQIQPVKRVVLGAAYTTPARMQLQSDVQSTSGEISSQRAHYDMPRGMALGASVLLSPRDLVSFDWSTKRWSQSTLSIDNPTGPAPIGFPDLRDADRIGIGYTREPGDVGPRDPLIRRSVWRAGFTWDQVPARQWDPETDQILATVTEWALTGGLGLPIQYDRGLINFLVEFGRTGNLSTIGVRETFIRLGLGFTFSKFKSEF